MGLITKIIPTILEDKPDGVLGLFGKQLERIKFASGSRPLSSAKCLVKITVVTGSPKPWVGIRIPHEAPNLIKGWFQQTKHANEGLCPQLLILTEKIGSKTHPV